MGVTWGATYGIPPPAKAERFMPQARKLGASFSRVTLYWSQLEPKEGVSRWKDLDAYIEQLSSADEGMITLASASPWATRAPTWVFPSSPALDSKKYYDFVRRVVEHAKGRVRYFQSDPEPSQAFFWSGTASEYAAQHKIFYRAVKDADANAVVVLGGCDGLFDPTGKDPMPGQDADLAFLRQTVKEAAGTFDLFDLHLYGNPYTIPERVETVKQAMRDTGGEKPIIVSEYDGPSFFEFRANRRWASVLMGPGANPASVRELRAKMETLPFETKIFLAPNQPDIAVRRLRLQMADLVARNLLALASGVQKTAFFDLWHDTGNADAPSYVLYGTLKLLEHTDQGLETELPLAAPFRKLAQALAGETSVVRIAVADHPEVYAYRIERAKRGPLLIAWRRPVKPGDASEALEIKLDWDAASAQASGIDETSVKVQRSGQSVSVTLTELPIFIE